MLVIPVLDLFIPLKKLRNKNHQRPSTVKYKRRLTVDKLHPARNNVLDVSFGSIRHGINSTVDVTAGHCSAYRQLEHVRLPLVLLSIPASSILLLIYFSYHHISLFFATPSWTFLYSLVENSKLLL